jgi:hypothetical protein
VLIKKAAEKKRSASKKSAAPKKRPGTKARAEAVKKILLNVEKKMSAEDLKATLGDYIRLIQLSKEMTDEPKTEITVMWIEE